MPIIPLLMLLSLIYLTITPTEFGGLIKTNYVLGQDFTSDLIQITSTSTFTDDLGNFHIIGEVNNTSTNSQTDIVVTAILSNTVNNSIVGNYSAFSSIETLRPSELSPFDILIQNPQQILGAFNFMEFSTTSQPAITEKPSTLAINGSSSFVDNVGNPHIVGSVINQGQSPEQFLNLVATFYDNSSLGVVGTQSFGLNVGNLVSNQAAPVDITITDNKTKSQAAFYSLNVDSVQSSMSPPLNPKFSFIISNPSSEQFITGSEPINPLLGNNQGINQNLQPITNNENDNDDNNNGNDNDDDNDNDNQRGEQRRDDNGNPVFDDNNCSEEPGSSGGDLSECEEAEREEQNEQEDEDSLDDNNENNGAEDDEENNNDDNNVDEENNNDDNNVDEENNNDENDS